MKGDRASAKSRTAPVGGEGPYRSTPVFDSGTLPAALRREHRTKDGVWGAIHVLAGEVELSFPDGSPSLRLTPGHPGIVAPAQPHWVTPSGEFQMRVDFWATRPSLGTSSTS